MRYPESAPEFPASRRSLSDVMPYARRGTFVAAAAALALANPNIQPVAEASENPEVATETEDTTEESVTQDTGHERIPDEKFIENYNIDGYGEIVVETGIFCATNTFDILVSVSVDNPETAPELVLHPHSRPDEDTDEYTEVGMRYINPDEQGRATAALYDIPEVGYYELSDPSGTLVNPDDPEGALATINPLFPEEICFEELGPAPEFDDQPAEGQPDENIEQPTDEPEPETAPGDDTENDAVEPPEVIEQPTEDNSAEVEGESAATEPAANQGPELPATGVSLKLLALAAFGGLAIGGTTIRRTSRTKSAR